MRFTVNTFALTGLLSCLIFLIGFPSHASSDVDVLNELAEEAGQSYDQLVNESIERGTRVPRSRYEEVFLSRFRSRLEGFEPEDSEIDKLLVWHRIIDSYLFYTNDRNMAKLSAQIADAIEAQGYSQDNTHLDETYEELVEARLIVRAESFSERHRGKFIPEVITWEEPSSGSSLPIVGTVEEKKDGVSVEWERIDLENGKRVILITHPKCHFSKQFEKHLEENERLRKRFQQYATWVVRQGATYPTRKFITWNKRHDAANLTVSYDDSAWPNEILFSLTPMFYFIKDGEIVHRAQGWTGPESADRIRRGLDMLEE